MNWTLLCQLIVLYFVFSVLGWMMEVTLKYIQYHRFINRGFLIGPYCPIYGSGVVLVTVLVGGLVGIRGGTPGEIFLAGFFICGGLEYFISWYMEKAFHARWWDYSQKPMNLNGRVWIGNLMLFGLASVVIVVWIDPVYFRLIEKLPLFWLHFAAIAIVTLLVSDCVVSHVMMDIVRREIDAQEGDSTATAVAFQSGRDFSEVDPQALGAASTSCCVTGTCSCAVSIRRIPNCRPIPAP